MLNAFFSRQFSARAKTKLKKKKFRSSRNLKTPDNSEKKDGELSTMQTF